MEHIYRDVTVVGAGIAGMCAAVAAARNGLKVALVQDRPVLGGNASSEIRVGICGSAANGNSPSVYGRESGIVEEIKLSLAHKSDGIRGKAMTDAVYFELIYNEPNIQLYLNTYIHEVFVEEGNITSVKGKQLNSEKQFTFISPLFIDCSGDGFVGYEAGAEYMKGREPKSQFNEDMAPEIPDFYTLGDTLMFTSRDTGRKVTYTRPAFAYDFSKMDFVKNIGKKGLHRYIYRDGKAFGALWWLEFGGQLDTIGDNEDIVLELRKLVYGYWDYIKNSGEFQDVDTLELDWVAPLPGKRESRRFVGEYILTQNDIEKKTDFYDSITIGGWTIDLHAPKGIYDEEPATTWRYVDGLYNIPYRCLYSKNIKNLLLAGRNISASHVAFGSTRVMGTCGGIGQAVGAAAAVCAKHGILPGDIRENYLQELVGKLQGMDQTILGRKEICIEGDRTGLTISASSEKEYRNDENMQVLPLDQNYCLVLPVVTDALGSVAVKLKNESNQDKTVHVDILNSGKIETYRAGEHAKEVEISVPAGFDGWIPLTVDCSVKEDRKLYIVFNATEDISIYNTPDKLTGVVTYRYYKGSSQGDHDTMPIPVDTGYYGADREKFNICFKDVSPLQEIYKADNVINGFSRPYGVPNLWISNGVGNDEYIEINFAKAKDVKELQLVFNSRLEDEHPPARIPEMIKDYDVEFTDLGNTRRIIEVRDNYMRVNRHPVNVKDIVKIRILPRSNYGVGHYEIFTVKLF